MMVQLLGLTLSLLVSSSTSQRGLSGKICFALFDPVCGKDGRTYSNSCQAGEDNVGCKGQCPCKQGVCDQPKAVMGPCEAYIPSWTFNQATRTCEQFVYGGCHGNENRFESKTACERICGAKKGPPVVCKCKAPQHLVCGEDGRTYCNPCSASTSNIKVACQGKCPCDTNGPGKICFEIYSPVCGKDGKTYSNSCEAGEGNVRCEGECPCRPRFCTQEYAPVCTKTGVTASNVCHAGGRKNVRCRGECPCSGGYQGGPLGNIFKQ